jgi:hypothetical protein
VTTYATEDDLNARISATYQVPANAEQLLAKASELIDEATLSRAQDAYDSSDEDASSAVTRATCDQVEFWIEVSENFDVAGLRGSLVAGRLQIHPVPYLLGVRAKRTLRNAGLLWAGVAVR